MNTSALPAVETDLDPELLAALQPPCEAWIYHGGFGFVLLKREPGTLPKMPCQSPARFIMRLTPPCTCADAYVLLACSEHTVLPGVSMRCFCCGGPIPVTSVEPL